MGSVRASKNENDDAFDSVGLCASCKHVRLIQSDKGTEFYLCRLSATDPRFPKYPRLPVLQCSGHTAQQDDGSSHAAE